MAKGTRKKKAVQRTVKVVVGRPAYRRGADVDHFAMGVRWYQSSLHFPSILFHGVRKSDTCCVDYARDSLIWQATQDDADWLLMFDSDTVQLDGAPVWRMILDADRDGAAVVGPPILMRNGLGFNVCNEPGQWMSREDVAGRVQRVSVLGSGMMAINLRWLMAKKPESPWFQTIRVPGSKPKKFGSDIYFSLWVNEQGGVVLADGRFEPTHIGVGGTGHAEVDERARNNYGQTPDTDLRQDVRDDRDTLPA